MVRDGLQGYFRKDISTLCILALLNHTEELYGYELMQRLQQYSGGVMVLPEGTLYPILYRLEAQGCVLSEKRQIGKRLQRVYYRITPKGTQLYQEMQAAFASTTCGVNHLLTVCEGKDEVHDE